MIKHSFFLRSMPLRAPSRAHIGHLLFLMTLMAHSVHGATEAFNALSAAAGQVIEAVFPITTIVGKLVYSHGKSFWNTLTTWDDDLLQHGIELDSFYDLPKNADEGTLKEAWYTLAHMAISYNGERLQAMENQDDLLRGFHLYGWLFHKLIVIFRNNETHEQIICFVGTSNVAHLPHDLVITATTKCGSSDVMQKLLRASLPNSDTIVNTLAKLLSSDAKWKTRLVSHSLGATCLVETMFKLRETYPGLASKIIKVVYLNPGIVYTFSEDSQKWFKSAICYGDIFVLHKGDYICASFKNLKDFLKAHSDKQNGGKPLQNIIFLKVGRTFTKSVHNFWCGFSGNLKVPIGPLHFHFLFPFFMRKEDQLADPWEMPHVISFLEAEGSVIGIDAIWDARRNACDDVIERVQKGDKKLKQTIGEALAVIGILPGRPCCPPELAKTIAQVKVPTDECGSGTSSPYTSPDTSPLTSDGDTDSRRRRCLLRINDGEQNLVPMRR